MKYIIMLEDTEKGKTHKPEPVSLNKIVNVYTSKEAADKVVDRLTKWDKSSPWSKQFGITGRYWAAELPATLPPGLTAKIVDDREPLDHTKLDDELMDSMVNDLRRQGR